MQEIVYNKDCLVEKDITETVIRAKALLINKDHILLGNAKNIYQFPGGHLEKGETLNKCLKREILEETGIMIEDDEIPNPFLKITYLNRNHPKIGKNRKTIIYYYEINTDKNPDLSKVRYTEHEKEENFKTEYFSLSSVIKTIEENIPNNPMNKIIVPDMIIAINMCLKNK